MVLCARLHERQLDWSSSIEQKQVKKGCTTLLQCDLQANSHPPGALGFALACLPCRQLRRSAAWTLRWTILDSSTSL